MNVYMTRQPVFDNGGSVYAYELLYRVNNIENAFKPVSEDGSTANTVENNFFGMDVKSIVGGAKAFINYSDDLIRAGVPKLISPEILVLEVSKDQLAGEDSLDAIQELKELGYMIALDDFIYSEENSDLFSLGDLVKIDFRAAQKAIEETAYVCRYSNKLILADNVGAQSECEYAKKLGCNYMQGYYFARSSIISGNGVQPLPVNLMQVMQLMAQPEPEIKDIVDVLSRDTAMCQRILRLINSVYFGVASRVSSINQAILILGLDYLREWVYLMGMQKITQNDNVEMMKLALLLAKFCRGLSEFIPAAVGKEEAIYLMGLLSMLVFSGDRALAQALDEFPLTNDIKKGLLRRGGLYGDVFEMAMAFVNGDWSDFDETAEKYHLRPDDVSDLFAECLREIEKINMA